MGHLHRGRILAIANATAALIAAGTAPDAAKEEARACGGKLPEAPIVAPQLGATKKRAKKRAKKAKRAKKS